MPTACVLDVWPGECEIRLERNGRADVAKARLAPAIREWRARFKPDHEARAWTWLGMPHETGLTLAELLGAEQ